MRKNAALTAAGLYTVTADLAGPNKNAVSTSLVLLVTLCIVDEAKTRRPRGRERIKKFVIAFTEAPVVAIDHELIVWVVQRAATRGVRARMTD